MSTVILFGASGYIGSHLERYFIKCGWCVIKITHHPITDSREFNLFSIAQENFLETLQKLRNIVDDNTVAINVAGLTTPPKSSSDIQKLYSANFAYVMKIVEIINILKIKSFINTGSYWQYNSDGSMRFENEYIRSKNCSTIYLRDIACSDLVICELVLYDVYGKDDRRGKLLNILSSLDESKTLDVSSGLQEICYVNIRDVCNAFLFCAEKIHEFSYKPYFSIIPIISRDVRTLREYIDEFLSYHPSKPSLNWGTRDVNNGSPLKIWKTSLAYELLEWETHSSFEQYAREYFNEK